MFGNNRELPPGFIVRRVRNSDISDVIKFSDNNSILQPSEESGTPSLFVLCIIAIALFLLLIVLSFISGSFITNLFYIVLTSVSLFLIIYRSADYLYWKNNINSGECFAIYHQNQIRVVISGFNFDSGSYIKYFVFNNAYRRIDLGTYLINIIRQNLNYPIYILCWPEPYLVEFYSNLGFVAIEEDELPRRISKSLGIQSISPIIPMMLEENLEA